MPAPEQVAPQGAGSVQRLSTGVSSLDEVLSGGLVRGNSYLVLGRPGTGKTVLGNHIAFNHARVGGTALVATVLSETHSKILAHLASFDFFSPQLVAERVQYVNLYADLSRGGLTSAIDALRRLMRDHRSSLLVLDGAEVFEFFASSPLEYHRFIYDLQAQVSALGSTTLLLSSHVDSDYGPIGKHVDGILRLEDETVGLSDVRMLHVVKMRGAEFLRGRHAFSISRGGIEVYPRLEAAPAASVANGEERQRMGFGAQGLDDMLHGGLLSDSTTLALGATGAGKTLLGLHFVAEGARLGESALVVSFHESPARLLAKAASVGLDLAPHVQSGRVRLMWWPPQEMIVDALARDLLRAVSEHRPQRLMLDTVNDLRDMLAFHPSRESSLLAALTAELRARRVTSLLLAESSTFAGATLNVAVPTVATIVENVILLRYVELRSELRRLISILKIRESDYDTRIREFSIGPRGIQVSETFESAQALLTDVGESSRPPGQSASQSPEGGSS